jgi:hypothetical protein
MITLLFLMTCINSTCWTPSNCTLNCRIVPESFQNYAYGVIIAEQKGLVHLTSLQMKYYENLYDGNWI